MVAVLYLAPDAAESLANLAYHVFAVSLNFGNLGAQHVSLFAVLKVLAAAANVVLGLDQDAGKLACPFPG